MKKKQIAKAVAFLLLLTIVLTELTHIFVPKWLTGTSVTSVTDEFYDQKRDTIEVGIIGSSQLVNGISCGRLLEKYGISAFSLATGEQPVLCGWFYLMELERLQHVKAVIYDTSMLYEVEEEARFRKTLDTAPMSMSKIRLILERSKSDEASDFFSYFFPLLNYHTRWTSLNKQDFGYEGVNTEVFWGNIYGGEVNRKADYEKICVDNEAPDETVQMVPSELAAFRKIVEFCQKKDIELILIKTPKTTWESAKTLGCQALADEYALPYLDFNRGALLQEIGFDAGNDMWNQDHMNVRGTDKLTDYMGEYLLSHYEFEDFRESPDFDEEKMESFRINHANKFLQTSIRVPEYLTLLQEERFEIMLQKTGDFSAGWDDALQQQIEQLGITTDLSALDGQFYAAQLRDDTAVCESVSAEPFEVVYTLADENDGAVRSDAQSDPIMAVSGRKIPFSQRGLNVVVYDKVNHNVADIATIFVNEAGALDVAHDIKMAEEQ